MSKIRSGEQSTLHCSFCGKNPARGGQAHCRTDRVHLRGVRRALARTSSTSIPIPRRSSPATSHIILILLQSADYNVERAQRGIVYIEDLDEPALKGILVEPKNALVKQYQRLFEMADLDLTFDDEALGAISKKAIERKTGARGLRPIMEIILLDTMFDLPSLDGIKEVVISKQVIEGHRFAAL
jgi:ATP-dependent protease Clp ATPase subunit